MAHIVVPLDGSPLAEAALELALPVATAMEAAVVLLRVTPVLEVPWPQAEQANAQKLEEAEQSEAHRYLARIAGQLRERHVEVQAEVRSGDPAEQIVFASRGSELVTMATHGRAGLQRWLLGSVTDRVVRAAQAPVLLIHPREDQAPLPTVRRIAVALDGSPLAERSLPHAARLARCLGASLVLVRVVPWAAGLVTGDLPGPFLEEMDTALVREAREYLERVTAAVEAPHVEIQIRRGVPADELIHMAAHGGADLIAIATHGRGGIRRWALGSVADRVLRIAGVPVLLVPAGVREAEPIPETEGAPTTA